MAGLFMRVRYDGKVVDTELDNVDDAGIAARLFPETIYFINHQFSCYEDCSLMTCLGALCPN